MHEPDKLLEDEVREELLCDTRLDERRIVVKAESGHVALSGWAPSQEQKAVAVDDTSAMAGVRGVADELLVGAGGEPGADAELEEACRRSLLAERLVPEGAVEVSVKAGRATLSGEVRHLYQQLAAERAVRRVDGALSLTSDVAVADPLCPARPTGSTRLSVDEKG